MIKIENGRARSVRTPEEVELLLARDLARLTPEERKVLELILQELKEKDRGLRDDTLLDAMGGVQYKTTPVDIRTFVKDPYFLGDTCSSIYPKLMEDLIELFEGGNYHEAIWTGSIGFGKTFVSSIVMCRILYEISCLKDPHASYGIAKDTNIAIVAFSVNAELASKVAFENIITKIAGSPYFRESYPFEPTKKEYRFPHNVWLAPRATTDTSALGLNVIAAMIDESNFLPSKKSVVGQENKSDTIYAAIKRRMKSRFERQGKLPGILCIVSSKKTDDDFTMKRIKESMSDTSVFVRDYNNWEVKPADFFSSKKFWVLCGSADVGSRILADTENVEEVRATLPEGAVLIDVPLDFKRDFEVDLEGAIRDIAGIASTSLRPYIQRREKIKEAFRPELLGVDPVPAPIEHPFSTQIYDLAKGGTFMWDRMVRWRKERQPGMRGDIERYRPIRNPGAHRHLHVDLAIRRDRAGIAMAHVGGWKDVIRRADDGRQYVERAPIYFLDFVLQVAPPIGGEIVFGEVRHLIYGLVEHGYSITSVSTDSWQSEDFRQILSQRGLNTQYVSVDTSPEPYDTLKTAIYENRILMYEYPVLTKELVQLEEDFTGKVRKINHPQQGRSGSKDCGDAVAGCIYTLSQQKLVQPLPIMRGLSGGQDLWMEEQRHAAAAGNPNSGSQALPAFLTGSGIDDDWGDGGGWRP